MFKALPYHGDFLNQPEYVVQVIRACVETSLIVDKANHDKEVARIEKERIAMERRLRGR